VEDVALDEGVALDASLVPPQGVAAGGAGVCHLVETVYTAGDACTGPGTHETENSSNDPGKSTGLRVGPGGDVVLAVWAHHGDGTVTKTRTLNILHLGDHLHGRGLWLHGLGGRGTSSLLW